MFFQCFRLPNIYMQIRWQKMMKNIKVSMYNFKEMFRRQKLFKTVYMYMTMYVYNIYTIHTNIIVQRLNIKAVTIEKRN